MRICNPRQPCNHGMGWKPQQYVPMSSSENADKILLKEFWDSKNQVFWYRVYVPRHHNDHDDPETKKLSSNPATRSESCPACVLNIIVSKPIVGIVAEDVNGEWRMVNGGRVVAVFRVQVSAWKSTRSKTIKDTVSGLSTPQVYWITENAEREWSRRWWVVRQVRLIADVEEDGRLHT